MKSIHHDAEGDILTLTFQEYANQQHTGIELSDNLVLYYNPESAEPIRLVIISYQALLRASAKTPIPLDGLTNAPKQVRATVMAMLERPPLVGFLQVVKSPGTTPPTSRLQALFTPDALQMVTSAGD
jgi:hypothetical protein